MPNANGRGNPTNGTTEWVRSLEERMGGRPIHLFTLQIEGKSKPQHYVVDVLPASEGDAWVLMLDGISERYTIQQQRAAIAQNAQDIKFKQRTDELTSKEPFSKLDVDEQLEQRFVLLDEQAEVNQVLKAEKLEYQRQYHEALREAMLSYGPDLPREEIEKGGLTHEQVLQAIFRLTYSTDPNKVQVSLALESQAANGLR